MMAIKGGSTGASLLGIRPEMMLGCVIIHSVFERHGYRDPVTGAHAVLTSGVEGEHSPRSRHYVGLATDWRRRHVPRDQIELLADDIRVALGREFAVIVEPTHIHVQFNGR